MRQGQAVRAAVSGPVDWARQEGLGLIPPKLSDHLYGAAAPETSLGAIGVGQGVLSQLTYHLPLEHPLSKREVVSSNRTGGYAV